MWFNLCPAEIERKGCWVWGLPSKYKENVSQLTSTICQRYSKIPDVLRILSMVLSGSSICVNLQEGFSESLCSVWSLFLTYKIIVSEFPHISLESYSFISLFFEFYLVIDANKVLIQDEISNTNNNNIKRHLKYKSSKFNRHTYFPGEANLET